MSNANANIAIIGGGIVGATAAYYLTRAGVPVTLYDHGQGQATKAAAGIICPWLSKRRNKTWYRLAAAGADFYPEFMADLTSDGYPSHDIFQVSGAMILRAKDKDLARDLEQAQIKRVETPLIGQVESLTHTEVHERFPLIESNLSATYVSGGGRLNGRQLIRILHQAIQDKGGQIISSKAEIVRQTDGKWLVKTPDHNTSYSHVLLAVGPWLNHIIEPLGLKTSIQPQKGQLFSVYDPQWANNNWPVTMIPGGLDILPFSDGQVVIGASHENDCGFDYESKPEVLNSLKYQAKAYFPSITSYPFHRTEVGLRAFTPDGSVLMGEFPNQPNLWAISGLASSGLTIGPYLAKQWVNRMIHHRWEIASEYISLEKYLL